MTENTNTYLVTGLKTNRYILYEFVVADDDVREVATLKNFPYSGYAHSALPGGTLYVSGGKGTK